MGDTATIELVYDPECPNVGVARKQLRLALSASALPDEWREWDRTAADSPSRVRGFGSPTILVNGRDIAGTAAPGANSCRVYSGESGKLAGFPSQKMIAKALEDAHRRGSSAGFKALALGGSVLSAVLAFLPAACCVGPLSLLLAGLGTASFGLALLPYAPYFSGVALLLLGANFYLTYRRNEGASCEAGTARSKKIRIWRTVLLWAAAAAVVAMSILPFVVAYLPVG